MHAKRNVFKPAPISSKVYHSRYSITVKIIIVNLVKEMVAKCEKATLIVSPLSIFQCILRFHFILLKITNL